MDRRLIILCFLVAIAMVVLVFPSGATALLVVTMLSAVALFIFRQFTEEKDLLTNIFLLALVARLAFGILIQIYNLRSFFGGDANTFDFNGNLILSYWLGNVSGDDPFVRLAMSTARPGWGI